MKKIFIVTNSFWNIFNFRSELINQILEKNTKLIISSPPDKFINCLDLTKYNFLPITYKKNSINFFQNLKIIIFYFLKIYSEKPDIFLLYTIKPNIFVSISALISFKKIKIYNFVTGLGSFYFEYGFKKKFILFLYRLAFLKSTNVIFQNLDDQNFFITNKVVKKEKCVLIPGSGINLNKFRFTPYPENKKNSFNFLCISRIIKDKGIEEYINAAELLKKDYPNVIFTLIGSVDYDYVNQLSDKTLEKMRSFIQHIDFTNEVSKYIEKCDCFVLPSYREGTSRALLEAASVGRPIITTNVPGCNNVVLDNFNGFLCKPRCSLSLYEIFKKMLNTNYNERKKMSINSRKYVETKFDVAIINKKILEMIGI